MIRELKIYDGEGNPVDPQVDRLKPSIPGGLKVGPIVASASPVSSQISSRQLTDEGIQEFIKSRIPREAMLSFIRRAAVDEKMAGFAQLLDYSSFASRIQSGSFYYFVRQYVDSLTGALDGLGNPTAEYIPLQNRYAKYAFDLILAILYEELASFSDIASITASKGADSLLIFEKMVVLEFDLYVLDAAVTGATSSSEKLHIVDDVPSIFHGAKGVLSYKDIQNVRDQIENIYADSLSAAGLVSLPTVLSGASFETGVSTTTSKAALARINGLAADCEGNNIALYSFLINYDVGNKGFIKRHKALYTSNDGYYVKRSVSSTGAVTSTTVYLGVSAPSGLRLTQFLHYAKYNSLTEVTDYKNARNLLLEFRRQISERTINY